MRLSSVSVSRVTFLLVWIHLLLWPCSNGSKAHGPPSDGSKAHGPPSDGSKAHGPPRGPPTDGSKFHGQPSDWSKAHGPPSDGSKAHDPPSDGSKAHGPPSDGSKAHGPPSDESKAHGPPRGPPSDGSKAHGPPSDWSKAHGPPSDGSKAHGPPSDGSKGHGPPIDGSKAHGPPSDGSKAHGPPRGPPSDGSKDHGPPNSPPSNGIKAHGPPRGPPNGSSPPVRTPGFQGPLESWVRTGFQYLRLTLCHGAPRSLPEGWCRGAPRSSLPDGWCRGLSSSLSEGECRRLAQLHMSGVAVYVSDPVESDKVVAILPNSYPPSLRTGGAAMAHVLHPPSPGHDGVLVLDPSPGQNFGHPLMVLYVDNNVTKKRCSHMDGIYVGEQCVTLALKGRCRNHLKRCPLGAGRLGGGVGRLGGGVMRGLMCDVHFLPLVVGVADKNHTQRLRCVDHPGFSRCPRPLPPMAPPTPRVHQASLSCELSENTRRCHVTRPVATPPSCLLYQTCDRAVLLAGSWQHHHVDKLQSFSRMLRSNGLHAGHVTTFTEAEGRYPAVQDKAAVRNHISYVCRKQHCADSLVLYLNCPTRCDGAMLLWDRNLNGIAEPQERYSVSELLADLAGCQASRVLVFADQSYSAVLDKRLRGSRKHRNVALIHRGKHRAPWNPTWEEGSWDSIGPGTCLLDHLGKSPGMSRLLEPWAGLLKVTLAGAPCDVTPPLTDGETRREYQGCQNLPTALWRRDPSPEPRHPSPKHHYYPSPQRQYYYHPSPHRKHY